MMTAMLASMIIIMFDDLFPAKKNYVFGWFSGQLK
jgi:hypothetical protein